MRPLGHFLKFELFFHGANQNKKVILSLFNRYISRYNNLHRIFSRPSDKLIICVDHYQTPLILPKADQSGKLKVENM
jgi:hypothetical protein